CSWIGSTSALGSVVMIENSVWSPTFGAFLVPRSPAHGRQIPAKKNGSLSARANQRHSIQPLGVFLSGSANAVARSMQRCWRSSHFSHWLFFRVRKLVPQLAPGLYLGKPHSMSSRTTCSPFCSTTTGARLLG